MKFSRFMLITAAILTIAACTKDKKDNEEEASANTTPQVELKPINTIELRLTNIEMDITWSEGKIIEIIKPSYQEVPLGRISAKVEDESIISISKDFDGHGFRVKPKKVGTTTVKFTPDKGPAEATCTVTVSEGDVAGKKEISSITAEETEIELRDLVQSSGAKPRGETKYVKVTLEPADASIYSDVDIWTDREDVLTVYASASDKVCIETAPNESDDDSVTGKFNVYIKAKRGSAKTATITVNVKGHVYGATLDAVQEEVPGIVEIEGGKPSVYLTVGDKAFDLKPRVLKTGPVKEEDDKWELYLTELSGTDYVESSDNFVEFTSGGAVKANSSSLSKKHFISVSVPAMNTSLGGINYFCNVPVYAYDAVSSLTVEAIGGAQEYYTVGEVIRLGVKVEPATARQGYTVENNDAKYLEITSQTNSELKLKVLKGKYESSGVRIKAKANPSQSKYYSLQLNTYRSSDVKPGDFVYYNSSTGVFGVSDGGLRFISDWEHFRIDETAKPNEASAAYLIGVVFDTESTLIANLNSLGQRDGSGTLTLKGLGSPAGKHVGIVSSRFAGKVEWCGNDSSRDLAYFKETWNDSKYGPVPEVSMFYSQNLEMIETPADVYKINQGWVNFNSQKSDKDKMKPMLAVQEFGKSTSSYTSITVPVDLSKCSGWLIAGNVYPFAHPAVTKSLKIISQQNLGDSNDWTWLNCLRKRTSDVGGKEYCEAWHCVPSKANNNVADHYGSVRLNKSEYKVRPILYL